MRAIVQRVASARVEVERQVVSGIEKGLLVFLGVSTTDTAAVAERLATKVAALRVFEDAFGKMSLGLSDASASILCVSQFTLYGDLRRGNRPSFDEAAAGSVAEPLYLAFCAAVERAGVTCARGIFGADMLVHLVNDGPVTLILDSDELGRPRHA